MDQLRVRDLMTKGVFAVLRDDNLAQLYDLMEGWRVRHAPVVDEDSRVIGLVSHRDMLRFTLVEQPDLFDDDIRASLSRMRVEDVMTEDVETAAPDDDASETARVMFDCKYGCLPVVEGDGHLVGILTEADFVRYFAERAPATSD